MSAAKNIRTLAVVSAAFANAACSFGSGQFSQMLKGGSQSDNVAYVGAVNADNVQRDIETSNSSEHINRVDITPSPTTSAFIGMLVGPPYAYGTYSTLAMRPT